MIKELTTHMKPICMGRFVMNVPQDMKLAGSVTLYYGLDKNFKTVDANIESLNASPESMRSQMDANAEKLAHGNKNWESKKPMLLDYRVINDHMIYLRKYRAWESAASSDHELHLLIGNTQIKLESQSFEGLDPEPEFPIEPVEQVQARLFELAKHIHGYEDPEQAGPGFCLGPLVIDSNQDEESAGMGLRGSAYSDLHIGIFSKGLTPNGGGKPLLERMASLNNRPDMSLLRKGDIALGGMSGQEWLAKGIDENDKLILGFFADSVHLNPALARPYMSISLRSGGKIYDGPDKGKCVDSSLTPREAVALWDAIISSIHVRPNAVRPKSSNQAPQR